MRISKLAIALFSLFLFTSTVQAGVLVEPYAGYSIGLSKDYGNSTYDYSTPQFGARLGYQFLGLMAGVDYSLSSSFDLNEKDKTTGATTKTSSEKNQVGLFVGYNLPMLLRAWGTYYLDANLKNTPVPATTYNGNGYALGVGFTGLPFVSLNLEYRSFSYDSSKTSGTKSTLTPKWKMNEILFSISLPINI